MTVPTAAHWHVGETIAGKYRIERVLGQGGMGVVVAATHVKLEQRVAIKFLLPELQTRPEVVERFAREARAAARIQSEHVAKVLDVGELPDGAPYLVMEFLEGRDLEHLLKQKGPRPIDEAVGYVLEACEAIAEAHAAGIVHRDLKPGNLFLHQKPDGTSLVKVCDFGISKLPPSSPEQAALTSNGAMMGSPAYMSPEQVRAAHDVDARSDIWSLGIILYELLAGVPPFRGPTVSAVVAAIVSSEPEPLSAHRTDVPAALSRVVDRCLGKSPGDRYIDVGELARALSPFAPEREASSVERIGHILGGAAFASTSVVGAPPRRAPAGPMSVSATSSRESHHAVGRRGDQWRWVIAGALLLGAISLVILVLRQKMASPPPPPISARPADVAPSASSAPVVVAAASDTPPATPSSASPSSESRRPKPPNGAKPAVATVAAPPLAPPTGPPPPAPPRNPLDVKLK